jgi:Na+/H+ antiporter NhaD/arsenite permease-like protein
VLGQGSVGLTIAIFAITYFGLAVGKLPFLRINRSGIALVGGTAVVVSGLLTPKEVLEAIDFSTLVLLFGMMVVVGYLRLSGVFELAASRLLGRIRSPRALLLVTVVLSGALSAFLVNDVVCIAMTPLVIRLAERIHRKPMPFLIGLVTAANIGSTATITGNPQNMIIGSLSRIAFTRFALVLSPIAVVGLAIDFVIVALVFRKSLAEEVKDARVRTVRTATRAIGAQRVMIAKGLFVTCAIVILFFAGAPLAYVALGAAAVMMLGRLRPERIYQEIDWGLLVMFSGLFVVVELLDKNVLGGEASWFSFGSGHVAALSASSAVLSNLVSNVPAVLLFKPFIAGLPGASQETAWLTLAMSSTLAGNLTVLGSAANLIVIEMAKKEDVEISYWDYSKAGVPLALVTLALGTCWMMMLF